MLDKVKKIKFKSYLLKEKERFDKIENIEKMPFLKINLELLESSKINTDDLDCLIKFYFLNSIN